MHNFCKRGIALGLLISLLLESCYNPYLDKKEPMPQPGSSKSGYMPDSKEYTASLPTPLLPTPSSEPGQANLALIQPIETLVIEKGPLQAPGTASFKPQDSRGQMDLKQLET